MAMLPSGRVTFWVTDVEGSTRLWEAAPTTMRAAMERHGQLLAAVADAHQGHVFKDTGDGVLVAFATADDALASAVEGMLALEHESWPEATPLRVRMGVHSGDAHPSSGDYHAPVVNRTARIGAAAHGGQIVVSAAARADLTRMPAEVSFRDLGPHRLRDLAESVELAQVLHPGLQRDFPPLRSLEVAPHNLPTAVSSLVGRDDDVAEVRSLLRSHRLVTLTGPGGVGKSRLALQVAAEEVGRHRDGVWRVELAASKAEAVASNLVSVLGIGDQPGRDPADVIVDHLRDREVLVVLDDCERVAESVGRLVRSLLESCRRSRVLATSREPLRVPGEQRWPVAPLPAPQAAIDPDVAAASAFESVGLFVERARSAEPGFALTSENVGAVAEICRRLDGLPLALELAAARAHVLAPAELLARLTDRFAILGDTRQGVDPRQQTLAATVAWSYEMLDGATRASFEALSVFAGAFRLADATELLGGADGAAPPDVDPVLVVGELVDRSLLQVDSLAHGNRYRLLDSIRAYGRDRLTEHAGGTSYVALTAGGWLDWPATRRATWEGRSRRSGSSGSQTRSTTSAPGCAPRPRTESPSGDSRSPSTCSASGRSGPCARATTGSRSCWARPPNPGLRRRRGPRCTSATWPRRWVGPTRRSNVSMPVRSSSRRSASNEASHGC